MIPNEQCLASCDRLSRDAEALLRALLLALACKVCRRWMGLVFDDDVLANVPGVARAINRTVVPAALSTKLPK
jgi:hypothetical protein